MALAPVTDVVFKKPAPAGKVTSAYRHKKFGQSNRGIRSQLSSALPKVPIIDADTPSKQILQTITKQPAKTLFRPYALDDRKKSNNSKFSSLEEKSTTIPNTPTGADNFTKVNSCLVNYNTSLKNNGVSVNNSAFNNITQYATFNATSPKYFVNNNSAYVSSNTGTIGNNNIPNYNGYIKEISTYVNNTNPYARGNYYYQVKPNQLTVPAMNPPSYYPAITLAPEVNHQYFSMLLNKQLDAIRFRQLMRSYPNIAAWPVEWYNSLSTIMK